MEQRKFWQLSDFDKQLAVKIANETGISPLLASVFACRGIDDPQYISDFLNPSLDKLNDPFLLNDMEIAVERIVRAIENKEKIIIYGDYDVDGVTSTSILYNYLKDSRVEVDYYIPDRFEEGYGLSKTGIERIAAMGTSLVITVDCGTTAFDEIIQLNSMGIDTIITDHHECELQLPEALAVINPCRHDSGYPFRELAGVGVVFKLINALCVRLSRPEGHLKYLDMVALGTVADVVPLVGENRTIAKFGLQAIKETSNTGLVVMIKNTGLEEKPISSYSISFILAPRINAAGRMGHAKRAVELFTTDNYEYAEEIFFQLSEDNKKRQEIELKILEEALATIEGNKEIKASKVLVVSGKGWHHGIIGIVAAKITEKYYKPCILVSIEENGMGRGSCRSIEGFDLVAALMQCRHVLEKFGGHEMAAGITIKADQIEAFAELINSHATAVMKDEDALPKLKVDLAVDKNQLKVDFVKDLELLSPFGAGNNCPVFLYNNLKLSQIRKVGEGKHLKLLLEDEGFYIDAIGFNMGSMADNITKKDLLDIVCNLEINNWNSIERMQLILRDIKLKDENTQINKILHCLDKAIDFLSLNNDNKYDEFFQSIQNMQPDTRQVQLEYLIPEREDMKAVYRLIKANSIDNTFNLQDIDSFSRKIAASTGMKMNGFKLLRVFEIFEELGFVKIQQINKNHLNITIQKTNQGKKNLEESTRFLKLQAYKK